MGAVDVGVEGGKLVLEGVTDVAEGGEVVTFVGFDLVDHSKKAGKALKGSGVQLDIREDMLYPPHAVFGVLDGHPTNDSVDFAALFEQQFGQVRAVLTCNSGDERFSHGIRATDPFV